MSKSQTQLAPKQLVVWVILLAVLVAAPVAVACVLCGGGWPSYIDGELWGGG